MAARHRFASRKRQYNTPRAVKRTMSVRKAKRVARTYVKPK